MHHFFLNMLVLMMIISEIMETNLATKQDIKDLENKIIQLENRLTIKLGTLLVVGFTTMATLLKF